MDATNKGSTMHATQKAYTKAVVLLEEAKAAAEALYPTPLADDCTEAEMLAYYDRTDDIDEAAGVRMYADLVEQTENEMMNWAFEVMQDQYPAQWAAIKDTIARGRVYVTRRPKLVDLAFRLKA